MRDSLKGLQAESLPTGPSEAKIRHFSEEITIDHQKERLTRSRCSKVSVEDVERTNEAVVQQKENEGGFSSMLASQKPSKMVL